MLRAVFGKQWLGPLLFCTAAISLYAHFQGQKKNAVVELASRLADLEKEKGKALRERDWLRLQIDSQNDPSWVEMILMRDLGVVPEGWIKIHFKK